MLPRHLSPTRLLHPSERPGVDVAPVQKPSRFRSLSVLGHLFRLIGHLLWLRLTFRFSRAEYGRCVRLFLERVGALWIRAGQLLALRSDVFSPQFCEQLSQLRDRGRGFPFDVAQEVVEQDLGAPLERIFDEFHPRPFHATTVSQVHMAHLRDESQWVAVNIQRPEARRLFRHDAMLIRRLVRVLRMFSIHSNMRWEDFSEELSALMARDLDYRFEASSVETLRKNLRRHGVYVYEVFRQYTTRRVLVTEFIRAALMSDFVHLRRTEPERLACWLSVNNVDPRKLARRLFRSVFRQIFEDNYFHASMHPENVILLRDGRFSVLQSPDVGFLESENLSKHRAFFQALVDGNYTVAADTFLFLASKLPLVDIAEVRSQLIRAFRAWETRTHVRELAFREKSITRLFEALNNITFRHGFETQWSMSRLAQTWASLDASLECLWPELNYLKAMRRYFRQASRRANRRFYRQVAEQGVEDLTDLAQFPQKLAENELFRETIVRRQAQVFQGSGNKINALLGAVCGYAALGLLLVAIFYGLAFMQQHHGVSIEPWAGLQLSAAADRLPHLNYWSGVVVLLLLGYLFRLSRRAAQALRQKEVRVPEARAAV